MIALVTLWPDLARGATLGFAVAAPIGPTALLCIRGTLASGRLAGLATGLGASTTHMLYAGVAAAGLAAITEVATAWQSVLQLLCAAFLVRMAGQTFRRRPELDSGTIQALWLPRAYATGLAYTLANPVTLVAFVTLTPGILGDNIRNQRPAIMAIGVLLGSAAWWAALTTLVASARSHLSSDSLRRVNLVIGMVLAGFAAVILIRAGLSNYATLFH